MHAMNEAHRQGQPLRSGELPPSPGERVQIVADLLDVRAWFGAFGCRLEVEQILERRLGPSIWDDTTASLRTKA
jgi:hypothetical protein